jgi:MFS transporter, DHA1 family, tetracycline resistance protein
VKSVQTRVVVIVFLTVFLDLIGFGIIIPMLPLYVKSMGGSAQVVGFILSVFSFTQLLATPILGKLSDKLGRRPVILVSLAGNAASMVIFAVATEARLLPLLFISRIIAGATAGNIAACQAAVADVTEGSDRAKGMGRVGAAIGLGMVMGPAAGGALALLGPWGPPMGAAALALLDLVAAFFLMPETRKAQAPASDATAKREEAGLGSLLREPAILTVFALYFLMFLAMTNMQVALALLAKERFGWGEKEVGAGFSAFGAVTLVIQGLLIGRLVKIFSPVRIASAGGLFMCAGLLGVAFATSQTMLIAGIMGISIGMGVNGPVFSTMASELAGESRRGAVLGFAQASGGLARTVGPAWSGFLFTTFSSGAPFLSGAVAATILAGLALTLGKRDAAASAGVAS